MVKVTANLIYKNEPLLSDVNLDVPKEYCNRESWNDYIKQVLLTMLDSDLSVTFDVAE